MQARSAQKRFEELYEAYSHRVLSYAARRLGMVRAEDIVADTFTVVWRRLDDLGNDPLPWILGIARRVIANDERGSRRRSLLQERVRVVSKANADYTPHVAVDEHEHVLSILIRLPEKHREVLFLAFWEDLSHQQAAAVLGCSKAAFAVRLHRARNAFSKEFNSFGHLADEGLTACAPLKG